MWISKAKVRTIRTWVGLYEIRTDIYEPQKELIQEDIAEHGCK